ncbi:MAG: M14 family zinc carboxypeptidase [Gammaproteobacteria bacterium]|nr:M14 family zinc carboxypeptidase [Gammaproteobacteria bacterium]
MHIKLRFICGLLLYLPGLAAGQETVAPSAALAVESPDRICERIGSKLASVSVSECNRQQMEPSGGVSVNGSPILIKTYPPLERREPLGKVLLVGGMHGDEYSSVSVVFKWMNILNKHHSGLFHWRFAPLVNPDGLLRDESQRMNASGVDLNRNFPTPDWQTETEDYWVNKTGRNPRRYPGAAPLSEPETRWLAKEIERFNPDVIVSVHAPYGVVDYDGPRNGPLSPGAFVSGTAGHLPGLVGALCRRSPGKTAGDHRTAVRRHHADSGRNQ